MDMSDKQPGNADASIPENHERTDDSWLPDEGEVKRLPRLKSKQKVRKLVIISVAVALVIAFAAWQLLPRLLNSGQEEQQQQRLSAAEIESTIVGTIALVSKDSHAISGGGQAVDVEISLANPGALSSGMSVTAKVETGARQIEGLETGTLEYAETKALRASS